MPGCAAEPQQPSTTASKRLAFNPQPAIHGPPLQDGIIRSHLNRWMQQPEFREMRDDVRWGRVRVGQGGRRSWPRGLFPCRCYRRSHMSTGCTLFFTCSAHHACPLTRRDMNQATSQDVFVGPYLDDPVVRAKFSSSYYAMTDGFLVSLVPCLGPVSGGLPGALLLLLLWALGCMGLLVILLGFGGYTHPLIRLTSAGLPHLPARHRCVESAPGPHLHLRSAADGGRPGARVHQGEWGRYNGSTMGGTHLAAVHPPAAGQCSATPLLCSRADFSQVLTANQPYRCPAPSAPSRTAASHGA